LTTDIQVRTHQSEKSELMGLYQQAQQQQQIVQQQYNSLRQDHADLTTNFRRLQQEHQTV